MSVKDSELLDAQLLAIAGVIYAPASFKLATLEELRENANGCGGSGSFIKPPKRIYGTLIVQACIIHDWMYAKGFTIEDKDEADRVFHNNMNRLISRDSHKFYKPTWLQRRRALKYYMVVKHCGAEYYWAGKN